MLAAVRGGPNSAACCTPALLRTRTLPIASPANEITVAKGSHARPNACRQVNFENPNYNIGLPVFTIHGNHDDPAGAENLSAVDILSSCNLVNYFGKVRPGLHEC